MQQQPRRWPDYDKSEETKLRQDVYIRPWPPGWSFWRRIYTSRGSEQVKERIQQLFRLIGFSDCSFSQLMLPSVSGGLGQTVERLVSDLVFNYHRHARGHVIIQKPNMVERRARISLMFKSRLVYYHVAEVSSLSDSLQNSPPRAPISIYVLLPRITTSC